MQSWLIFVTLREQFKFYMVRKPFFRTTEKATLGYFSFCIPPCSREWSNTMCFGTDSEKLWPRAWKCSRSQYLLYSRNHCIFMPNCSSSRRHFVFTELSFCIWEIISDINSCFAKSFPPPHLLFSQLLNQISFSCIGHLLANLNIF